MKGKSRFSAVAVILAMSMLFTVMLTACDTPQGSASTSEQATSSQPASDEASSSQPASDEASSNQSTSQSTAPALVACDISTTMAKKTYLVGEEFSSTGITGTFTFEGGSPTYGGPQYFTIDSSAFKKDIVGEYTINVSYSDLARVSYTVGVYPKATVNAENKVIFNISDTVTTPSINANGEVSLNSVAIATELIRLASYDSAVIKQINVAPGRYEGKISVDSPNVRILGTNAGATTLHYGDCSQETGTDKSAATTVNGDYFFAQNITFENSFDYLNATVSSKQALAINVNADKCVFDNCTFLGYQDTVQLKTKRQFFNNCTIKGCTDFIFGNNPTAVFYNSDIVCIDGAKDIGYITAFKGYTKTKKVEDPNDPTKEITVPADVPTYGCIFYSSRLTAEGDPLKVADWKISLGRPWRSAATVAFLYCSMDAHISKLPYKTGTSSGTRYTGMSGDGAWNTPDNAFFVEHGNTGDGAITAQEYAAQLALVDPTADLNADEYYTNDFRMLSNSEIENYNFANIFAATNGGVTYADSWDAISYIEALGVVIIR